MASTWAKRPDSIYVTKKSGEVICLSRGDCISYDGRESGVKIANFVGGDDGPICMEYVPWRGDHWASPKFSLRGNQRCIICYPTGYSNYGQHINWDSVVHVAQLG
jgi:hypothetical protein